MNIPGYQINREIGKGGMSTVYLAIQESLDRDVALKIMAPALAADADFCKRFLKEGRIIAKLVHPNIVTVYDIGAYKSYYYMALEYAGKGNLTQYIQSGLTVDQSLIILKQITSALGYAHSRGFIHRDVKPGNILFRTNNTPLLSDFGIAKALSSGTQLTMIGLAVGTPQYMSPEQLMAKPVSAQSDFYSLGVVFYEMLTGDRPFEGEDSFSIALKHINKPIPDLPEQYAEFQPFLNKLLAKDPADRFLDSEQLIYAIEEIQARNTFSKTRSYPPILLGEEELHAVGYQKQESGLLIPPLHLSPHKKVSEEQALRALAPSTVLEPQGDLAASTVQPEIAAPASSAAVSVRPANSVIWKWIPGVLLLLILAGSGLYMYYHLLGPEEVLEDAFIRSVSIRSPTDFVQTRMQYLQEAATAYQRILRIDPSNSAANEGLQTIADKYQRLAQLSWANGNRELSLTVIDQALSIMPEHNGLLSLRREIEAVKPNTEIDVSDQRKIERLLKEAESYLSASRFVFPVGENAVEAYKRVLQLDPDNQTALRRLNEMAAFFEQAARNDLNKGEIKQAILKIEQGLMINPEYPGLLDLKEKLKSQSGTDTMGP
jgi:serine/threonine protein kinase